MTQAARHLDLQRLATLDFSTLIEVGEAAALLGQTTRHLRRLCAERLDGEGMACLVAPPGQAKPRWYIDRRWKPELCPGARIAKSTAADLELFTRKQRESAIERRECVIAFRHERQHAPGIERHWLPPLIKRLREQYPKLQVSRSSLYRWDVDLDKRGIVGLVNRRGGNQRAGGDPTAWSEFEKLYLHTRMSAKECWRQIRLREQAGEFKWCSYKSLLRHLDSHIPPERQMYYRDRSRWERQQQPTIAQAIDSFEANECWLSDHKQADVWVRYGKKLIRPWITSWQDWRTRRIVAFIICPSPNSSTVLASFRVGVLDPFNMGGPRIAKIDNGKDYQALIFHGSTRTQRLRKIEGLKGGELPGVGLFSLLGVECQYTQPYNGNGKSRIERWHRSLAPFFESFASYAGRSVETKPPELEDVLKNPKRVPAFNHFVERFAKFIGGYNLNAEHEIVDLVDEIGQPMSPNDAFREHVTTRRVYADPSALDLMLQHWCKPTTVGRNGISIVIAGERRSYGWDNATLMPFKGRLKSDRKPVRVSYDPQNTQVIRVYDEQWRFVCEAVENEQGGMRTDTAIGREHVGELNRRKRAYRKAVKVVNEQRYDNEIKTSTERLYEIAQEQRRDLDDGPHRDAGHNVQVIQTPLDGQGRAVERERLRKAAGAEAFTRDDDDDIEIDFTSMRRPGPVADECDDDEPLPFINYTNRDAGETPEELPALHFATEGETDDDDIDIVGALR